MFFIIIQTIIIFKYCVLFAFRNLTHTRRVIRQRKLPGDLDAWGKVGVDVLSVGPVALQRGPVSALDGVPRPLHAGLQGLPQTDLLQGAHTKVQNCGGHLR